MFHALRHVRIEDTPFEDVNGRLALLTVPTGLRQVAAVGFAEVRNEGHLRTLRDILVPRPP